MQQDGIDWYTISKINPHALDLSAFDRAICSGEAVGRGLDRVSLQYRKKLLVLFQMAAMRLKAEKEEIQREAGEMTARRDGIAMQMARKQQEASRSFKQIQEMSMVLQEKKKMLAKFKNKAKKQPPKANLKVYVCPEFPDEQFVTKQALKVRMIEHNQQMTKSQGGQGVNQIKDLLMTMKEKEMEMMSMFLRASRERQTEQLQRAYQKQYQKAMQVSGKTDFSRDEEEAEQLHGQSKFLFFQKSEGVRRQMQRDQEFRAKFQQKKQADQEELNKQFYQTSRNYYEVFGSIEENVSQNELPPKASPNKNDSRHEQAYYDPNAVVAKFVRNYGQKGQQSSRQRLIEQTPKPYLEFKETQLVEQASDYASPSISDRLRQINQARQKHMNNNSMFSTKRKFHQSDRGYVFNCGPLQMDPGGDSDQEDYFGDNPHAQSRVEDEEIKMNYVTNNRSGPQYIPKSDSFHLSKLLSPKDESSASVLGKEKSSINLEFSDSFTKRDLQLSKDQTVNLSDLRLSKLQRKREEERKMAAAQVLNSPQAHISVASYSTEKKEIQNSPQPQFNALKSFEKEIVPLKAQNYRFQESSSPVNPFLKTTKDRVGMVPSAQETHYSTQGGIGILSQFLREEVQPAPVAPLEAQLKNYLKK